MYQKSAVEIFALERPTKMDFYFVFEFEIYYCYTAETPQICIAKSVILNARKDGSFFSIFKLAILLLRQALFF